MRWRLRLQVHAVGRSDGAIVAAVPLFALALWLPPVMLQRPTYSYLVTFDLTGSFDALDARAAQGQKAAHARESFSGHRYVASHCCTILWWRL